MQTLTRQAIRADLFPVLATRCPLLVGMTNDGGEGFKTLHPGLEFRGLCPMGA